MTDTTTRRTGGRGRQPKRQKDPATGEWPRRQNFTGQENFKHGANSARALAPIVAELRAHLLDVAPWVGVPAFAATVDAWAHAEAQCRVLRSWVDENGLLLPDGSPLPALERLDKAETRAGRLRAELGLTPAGWSKLVTRLGSSPEAAVAGVEALRAIGSDLDRKLRALPASSADLRADDSKEGHVCGRKANDEAGS